MMQEEGWPGEWERICATTLFMTYLLLAWSHFVSASNDTVTGNGRFPQPRDAIRSAEVKRSPHY